MSHALTTTISRDQASAGKLSNTCTCQCIVSSIYFVENKDLAICDICYVDAFSCMLACNEMAKSHKALFFMISHEIDMRGFWLSVFFGEEDWELSDFELILSLRERVAQKDQAYNKCSPRYSKNKRGEKGNKKKHQ